MTSDFERRWERIQQQLQVQMSGSAQPRVSSGRTLFGIKSEGERKWTSSPAKSKQSRQPAAAPAHSAKKPATMGTESQTLKASQDVCTNERK